MNISLLAANALPIICIVCATVLALRSREGWGWMVTLAFITAAVPKAADKMPAWVPPTSTLDHAAGKAENGTP
ncbi:MULTISPECIES: hypothetical protein [unclassified Methylobacterium]|uniref:hypothetical protein n=1 Tax=unclassified Methylobacterium TaxID=2615210 RepID=UPI0011C1D6B9|nr:MULTISPECIES: hypothetical protein [unclassified Methylobacterium]QEE41549.1 hypothetical protein FVA80_23990 [Methylobacterium sp. WL1]TXN57073.1 hypothetical protein FV241_12695 [Methylobacterium sp. WL2]